MLAPRVQQLPKQVTLQKTVQKALWRALLKAQQRKTRPLLKVRKSLSWTLLKALPNQLMSQLVLELSRFDSHPPQIRLRGAGVHFGHLALGGRAHIGRVSDVDDLSCFQ